MPLPVEDASKHGNSKTVTSQTAQGTAKPTSGQSKTSNAVSPSTGGKPALILNMHRRSPSPKSSSSKRLPSPNVDPQTEADMLKVKKQVAKVRRARLYLLQQLGPNSFLIGGDSAEHKYRVVVGQQCCSCGKDPFCIHLLFVMLRVFQLKDNDPILWKRLLKNFEVETLFRSYHQRLAVLSKQKVCLNGKRKDPEKHASADANSGGLSSDEGKVMKEEDDSTCPICLLDMVEGESMTVCRNGCNNRLHHHCMAVWSRDCRRRKERVNCPLCRALWTTASVKLDHDASGLDDPSEDVVIGGNAVQLGQDDATVPHGELIPSEYHEITLSWVQLFGHDIVACLFSRDWKIREAGLRSLSRRAVKTLTEQHDSSVKWNSLEVSFSALTLICKDPVYNVYIASLRTLKAVLHHAKSLLDSDIRRSHALLKVIIENILVKCADSNRRIAVVSTRILVDFVRSDSSLDLDGENASQRNTNLHFLLTLLRPPVNESSPPWQWWVGRLVLLKKLVDEHFTLLLTSQVEEERLVPSSLVSPSADFDLGDFLTNIDETSHSNAVAGKFEHETTARLMEIIQFCSLAVNVRHKKASRIALAVLVKATQIVSADYSALERAKGLLLGLKPVVRQTLCRHLSQDNIQPSIPQLIDLPSSPRRSHSSSGNPSSSTMSPRSGVLTPPPSPPRDPAALEEIDAEEEEDASIDDSLRFLDYNAKSNAKCKQLIQEEEAEAVAMAMDISINLVHRVVPEELVRASDEDVLLYVQPDPNKSGSSNGRHVFLEGVHWSKGTLLGTGAYSSCYEAMDFKTGRLMAVKQVSFCRNNVTDQERVHEAIIEEVSLLHRLKHPHIVHCLGATQLPGHVNIFMEMMPGGSVASLLSRFGAFKEDVVIKYLRQIVVALHHLHSNHILHRDVKGANILVDVTGQIVKLSDFGTAARLFSHGGTGTHEFCGQLLGTISFMAPEVIRGETYGRKCDIWSVGCVLIEMVTGRPPWDAEAVSNHLALMYKIASSADPPQLPNNLSPALRDFAIRCLEVSEADRPSAKSLLSHSLFRT